jgi:O-antigen ligase
LIPPDIREMAAKTEMMRRFVRYSAVAAIVTAFGYSLGYSTIGFGLLFLGSLWSLARYRTFPWKRTALDLPLAGFGAVLIVAAVASPYRELAMGVTVMLLVSAAVYFGSFTWLLHGMPAVREQVLRAWAAGAVVAAAIGLAHSAVVYQRGAMVQGRAEIPRGVGPNGLGTTLMLGGILLLGLAFRTGGRKRVLWIGTSLLCLAGLLASGSRASLAGWMIGAAYLLWRELRAQPRRMAAIAAAGVLLLVGIAAVTPQLTLRLGHTLSDVSGNRLRIWHTSLEMIADHPVLGTGFGTFERAYDRRRVAGMSPEPFAFNLWLNLAVETGGLGLAAALWVAIEAVRAWRRSGRIAAAPDPWRSAVGALWIALLVDQFADNTLFSISTSAALWLLLALVVVPPSSELAPATGQIAPSRGR